MPDIELISFETCPYVERSRIVLEEKGVDYEVTNIDLSDKPDWFLEISPRGKVPVLRVDERPIFESYVINEFLEERFPDPRMLPGDVFERARSRSWIVYNNDEIMGPAATLFYTRDDDEKIDAARKDLRRALVRIDEQLGKYDGKFFFADTFGLIDAVYAPIFTRWPVAEELGHGDLMEGLDNLSAYASNLVERPSVQEARYDDLVEAILEH